jgi:hypothetical protein
MKYIIIASLALAAVAGAYAEKTSVFQLSLSPDIAIQDRETRIKGVSIGVWNENPHSGWSIGFVSGFTGDSLGFSWMPYLNFFNYAENYKGVHWGWVNYTSGNFSGWQSAMVNVTHGEFVGLQSGFVNYADTLTGVQLGAVNVSKRATGFQWAIVNYTESAQDLLQLGLVNLIADNSWFGNFPGDLAQGFIIANWSFGGEE